MIDRNKWVNAILKIGDFFEIGIKLTLQSDKRVLFVILNPIRSHDLGKFFPGYTWLFQNYAKILIGR